jgi:hypothetical protein
MKMNSSRKLTGLFGALALVAMAASGCVDEEIVFRDRPLFDEVPAGAQGFVGYADQEAGRTVCGSCHIGTQARWAATAHADAWATLQATGDDRAFCQACHTVSERGNPVDGDAGWVATGNPRYYDVQCESCHGPGWTTSRSPTRRATSRWPPWLWDRTPTWDAPSAIPGSTAPSLRSGPPPATAT